MPEIRQSMATKEWVIIATERAKRPKDFISKKNSEASIPESDAKCPFCPGNEKLAPPATFEIMDGENWITRVVPNKFPALSPEGERKRKYDGIHRYMTGVGNHEVIIESRLHNRFISVMKKDEVLNIVKAYKNRYTELAKDERIEHIIIFKNHGAAAGTSLIHPHSQVVALPLVPQAIRSRLNTAMRYLDDNGTCVFCDMSVMEQKEKERIVYENDDFIAFCPYASLGPFHIWILPKRHMAQFSEINEPEMTSLADSLKIVLTKLSIGLNNPDYNLVVKCNPTDYIKSDFFHWYIAIVPRLTKTAGFELGTGMFINVSLPEENAEFLRSINI
ncbi:galactose-1-phosphate uridylyltransferase [Candidatus Dependentiae bacterium]|nr:galactose-1-phosphate uridylyltransferase [Candidatus Dependentiae bacterium]